LQHKATQAMDSGGFLQWYVLSAISFLLSVSKSAQSWVQILKMLSKREKRSHASTL